jgi:murein DD-endopeptidase MepM/ murein hydrolase activator NlpD
VVHARAYSDYGNLIRIDHGFGSKSRYGHLEVRGRVGRQGQAGDLIGRVGATGRATARISTTKFVSTTGC